MRVERQELKYFVNPVDIIFLRHSLRELMNLDENAVDNQYTISSLYFDTPYDDDLFEKISGIYKRKKYRVRIYNNQDTVIKMETKHKVDNSVYKESAKLSRELAEQMANSEYDGLLRSPNPYLQNLYGKLRVGGYGPKAIVEYDREAYTLPFNNIRITFDLNLRTYNSVTDLFNPDAIAIPAFFKNLQILEVKFNGSLPPVIKRILSKIHAERQSISKYSICRRYIKHSDWEEN